MKEDNLFTKEESRTRIIDGIKRCAEAVGGTMGTGGYNAIIEAIENPGHLVTNDGITILESIHFADPLQEMGRKILLESVSRANKASGDGSSTTTILTNAILQEGKKHIGKINPMDIKRELEACLPVIEKAIKAQKKNIRINGVGQVATISAEDKGIGKMIQDIYKEIGKDGIIYWDISKTFDDHYTIGKGITIDGAGMASPYMADLDEKTGAFQNIARWSNAHVLITKQKITSASDFNEIFQALFSKDIKEVVVFCDEYEANVISHLIKTRAVRGFKTLLVKMPVLWKDLWYADLAKATGATVIDPEAGLNFKNTTLEHLGKVKNIVVSKGDTFIDGIQDITDHIKALEEEDTDEAKLRISRLNTKTARYFVGAASDSALSYRRLKVEDAISAAYQALHHGIVAGGGITLRDITSYLPNNNGGRILKKALVSPVKQIADNAGVRRSLLTVQGYGVDTRTGERVHMIDSGIIDPANVVLNAVKNAISVASMVLTSDVTVLLPQQEQQLPDNLPQI